MQTSSDSSAPIWNSHARKVARKVNFGWWLQSLSTPLVVVGLLGSCGLLLLRRSTAISAGWMLVSAVALGLLVLAGTCWFVARRRFEGPDQSLVRIEATMKLRNALSAAKAGVAPWPAAPPVIDAGLNWSWQRVLVPPLAAIAFLSAGLFIPLSAGGAIRHTPEEPQAWQKLEADIQRLEDDKDIIDQSYVEEVKKQLAELKAEDPQTWFSHSSLEATDSLKQNHSSELQKLDRELSRASKAMSELQKDTSQMSPSQKQSLLNQFDQAVKNLEKSGLKPNSRLMEQLKGLDPSQMGQMTPDQLQQLQQNMQKAAQAAKDLQDGGQGQGDQWNDELNDGNGQGDGKGQDQGQGDGQGEGDGDGDSSGDGLGQGGVDRGPGHSSDMLGKEHDRTKTGDLTGVQSKDLSHAKPGDLLELQDSEHDVDKSPTSPQTGGNTNATGSGGDRVWKERLDPSEQKALKKFFD